eukprot:8442411-Alexandrium_andersonii.AAC.2
MRPAKRDIARRIAQIAKNCRSKLPAVRLAGLPPLKKESALLPILPPWGPAATLRNPRRTLATLPRPQGAATRGGLHFPIPVALLNSRCLSRLSSRYLQVTRRQAQEASKSDATCSVHCPAVSWAPLGFRLTMSSFRLASPPTLVPLGDDRQFVRDRDHNSCSTEASPSAQAVCTFLVWALPPLRANPDLSCKFANRARGKAIQ